MFIFVLILLSINIISRSSTFTHKSVYECYMVCIYECCIFVADFRHNIITGHFPENRDMIFLIGHSSKFEYFFRFSFNSILLILKKTIQKVTSLQLSNLLFYMYLHINFALSKR